jgi:hypothetical protein
MREGLAKEKNMRMTQENLAFLLDKLGAEQGNVAEVV